MAEGQLHDHGLGLAQGEKLSLGGAYGQLDGVVKRGWGGKYENERSCILRGKFRCGTYLSIYFTYAPRQTYPFIVKSSSRSIHHIPQSHTQARRGFPKSPRPPGGGKYPSIAEVEPPRSRDQVWSFAPHLRVVRKARQKGDEKVPMTSRTSHCFRGPLGADK